MLFEGCLLVNSVQFVVGVDGDSSASVMMWSFVNSVLSVTYMLVFN